MLDENGNPEKRFGTMQGITERKQAEDRIKGLAKFPEENPNPVMRVFKDGKLLYNNKSSMVLLDSWGSQTTKRLPDNYIKIVSDVLDSGLSNTVEVECGNCVFALTFAPIMEGDYVNIYGLDITSRKQADDKMKGLAKFTSENPNPVLRIEKNGTILFANNAGSIILDCWNTQTGQSVPEDWHKLVLENIRSGTSNDYEMKCRDQVFSLTLAPVTEAGYVNIYGLNITKRKKVVDDLRASEENYRILVSSVKDYAIFMTSPDGIILSWNEGVRAIKGYTADEVIGKHISIFYPEEDIKAGKIEHELQKAKEEGKYEDDGWRVKKDGSRFWANVIITAINDDSGKLVGYTKVTRDLTERKKAEDEIKGLAKFPEENPNPVMRVFKDGKLLYNNKSSMVLLDSWGFQTTKRLPDNYIKIVSDVLDSALSNAVEVECGNCVFSLTFAPIMEEGYVNIYGLDITSRKRAVKELKQSEERYRTLVQTIPDIIYKIDENGFFTFLNNSVRTLGYKPKDLIGKHFSSILHPDDIKSFSRFTVLKEHSGKETGGKNVSKLFDERRTQERMTRSLKLRLIPKDQDMLKRDIQGRSDEISTFGEITATGIYHKNEVDEYNYFDGTVGIITDITDKMKMQAEMVRADQLALIGKMAAGLSHEINNPINGIMNSAQLIMDESKGDTRLYRFSKIIIEESKRIATLTKNLLYLSRRTVGQKSHVQIYEILYNSLNLMMIQLKKDNIIVKFNISKDTPAIYGSFQEIQQVFLNLVQNAGYALNEKYPGKDMGKILEISCNRISISNNQYVRVIFHDHGIGIPENLLSKTTNPFFSTKPLTKGTGLGLSICQRIMDNHDGKMVVESVYGEFTKIIIDLPVTK